MTKPLTALALFSLFVVPAVIRATVSPPVREAPQAQRAFAARVGPDPFEGMTNRQALALLRTSQGLPPEQTFRPPPITQTDCTLMLDGRTLSCTSH